MSDKEPTNPPALDDAELRRILSRHGIKASDAAMGELLQLAGLSLQSMPNAPAGGDGEESEAIRQAWAEGMKAGIELAEKAFRLHLAAQQQHRQTPTRRTESPRYDWIDHLCGIPLIDKIMGIK